MTRSSELVLTFLVNAAWQIAAVTLVASIANRLLRNSSSSSRHNVWVAALLLSFLLPALSLFSLSTAVAPSSRTFSNHQAQLTATDSIPAAARFTQQTSVERDTGKFSTAFLPKRNQRLLAGSQILFALALAYALWLLYRSARLLICWRQTNRLRRSIASPPLPAEMREVAERCAAAMRLECVSISWSLLVKVPVTLGARKPLIVLPADFPTNLPSDTISSVLGHEMAHVARRDFALNLVYELLLLPISFHPLARFIKREIDRTRELACDELVTERLLEPKQHARSLVQIAGALMATQRNGLSVGIFDANILEERIMRLTQNHPRLSLRKARLVCIAAFASLCFAALTISTFSFDLRAMAAVDVSSVRSASASNALNALANSTLQSQEPVPAQKTTAVSMQKALDGKAIERAQRACEAGKNRELKAISALISLLGDDTQIEPVKCWENERWSPALSTFRHPSPGEQAALALASMGAPAFAPLLKALESSNACVRRNAAWAIGELTNTLPGARAASVERLIALMNDGDPWVRMAAARSLGELRDRKAGESLVIALSDHESAVRQMAAWALGEMKDERAVDQLCNVLLLDTHAEVRVTAAEALGVIGSQKAVQSLGQALSDSEPRVRSKVKWAIAEMEG